MPETAETLNRSLVEKMIKRIQEVPESYDQDAFYIEESKAAPCGTVACLAGEAVICNALTPEEGIKNALRLMNEDGDDNITDVAARLLGLPYAHSVFAVGGQGWPKPHAKNFEKARTKKEQAQVAVAYLKECLERGTMIW